MTNSFRKSVKQLVDVLFEAAELSNSSVYTMIKGFTVNKLADHIESKFRENLQMSSSELYSELNKLSRKWTRHILSDIMKLRKVAIRLGDQEKKLLLVLFLAALTSAMLNPQSKSSTKEE